MRNFHLCKADKSSEIIQGSKSKRPSCRIDFNLFNICTRDSFVRVWTKKHIAIIPLQFLDELINLKEIAQYKETCILLQLLYITQYKF